MSDTENPELSKLLSEFDDIAESLNQVAELEKTRHGAIKELIENYLKYFRKYMNEDIYEGSKEILERETQTSEAICNSLSVESARVSLLGGSFRAVTGYRGE